MERKHRNVRRDKGTIMATPRDFHLITWIADQYACRQDHLRELFSQEAGAPMKGDLIALSTLKDQIERWKKAGWIEYQRYLAGEPGWAWVTKAGLRLVGLDHLYLAKHPAPIRYAHLWAVNALRLFTWPKQEGPVDENQVVWMSERRLRAEMISVKKHPDHRPAPVQIEEGMIPDAVVLSKDEVFALEVELTPKKPEETQEKLERLCRATYHHTHTGRIYVYDKIVFFVPDKAMQHHLERARTHLNEEERMRVEIRLDEHLVKKP